MKRLAIPGPLEFYNDFYFCETSTRELVRPIRLKVGRKNFVQKFTFFQIGNVCELYSSLLS
jgi:hypothetical protein